MDVEAITVFLMSHLAKVVFSGHVSGVFFHCLVFRSGVSTVESQESCNSRLFATWNENKTSHLCLCGDSESTHWKSLGFIIPQNPQSTREKGRRASKEWLAGGDA